MSKLQKPPALQTGDKIGLISPSSGLAGMLPHRTKMGISTLKNLGFEVMTGKHALTVTGYTAGTAQERAEDINSFFRNKNIKAIICFIGGNHSNQIIKYLDFDLISKNPKIFLGYSDATVLHLALNTQSKLVTFYGPAVLTQFSENPSVLPYTLDYFQKAVMNKNPIGTVRPSLKWTDETLDWFKKEDLKRPRKSSNTKSWKWLHPGKAKGKLLGGCLPSLMHLRGTKYWPDFSKSILFWETPESHDDFTKGISVSDVDSLLSDLELSGTFDQIVGMIVGRPYKYSPDQMKELVGVISKKLKPYKIPILFNIDIGHTDPMLTLPIGVQATLDSSKNELKILESGVK